MVKVVNYILQHKKLQEQLKAPPTIIIPHNAENTSITFISLYRSFNNFLDIFLKVRSKL
jgi:hypothetical protein